MGQAAVARHAGITRSHLSMIEAGTRAPSWPVLTRIAAVLGSDLSVRLFPGREPRLRDRFQAPMVEALLKMLPDRWSRAVEVAVHRPARGFIDCVISDRDMPRIVSIEAHSEIRRLEALIRSAIDKSESLPSSDLWPFLSAGTARPPIHRVLLLRSTAANREIARSFAATLSAAYPARTAEVVAALARSRPSVARQRHRLGPRRTRQRDDPPRRASRRDTRALTVSDQFPLEGSGWARFLAYCPRPVNVAGRRRRPKSFRGLRAPREPKMFTQTDARRVVERVPTRTAPDDRPTGFGGGLCYALGPSPSST
jgi:DNA-binding XRE family transcriptional regulator